jgi:hypothetical protein
MVKGMMLHPWPRAGLLESPGRPFAGSFDHDRTARKAIDATGMAARPTLQR